MPGSVLGPRRAALAALQVVITGAVIAWIIKTVSLAGLKEGLARLPWPVLWIGLLVYAVMTIGRVFRFRMLRAAHVGFADMLAIVWVHNLLNNLLPFRLGEASYLLLAKRVGGIASGTSFAAILVSRVGDLMGLSVFLLVALAIAGNPLPVPSGVVVLALLVCCFGGVAGIFGGRAFLGFALDRVAEPRRGRLWRGLDEIRTLLAEVHGARIFGPFLAWSLAMVFIGGLVNYWVLRAVGIPLDYWQTSIALAASFLTAVLPIQPVGGWGVFEGAAVLGLTQYGIDARQALAASVALHVANYFFFCPLGAIGWLWLSVRRRAPILSGLQP